MAIQLGAASQQHQILDVREELELVGNLENGQPAADKIAAVGIVQGYDRAARGMLPPGGQIMRDVCVVVRCIDEEKPKRPM